MRVIKDLSVYKIEYQRDRVEIDVMWGLALWWLAFVKVVVGINLFLKGFCMKKRFYGEYILKYIYKESFRLHYKTIKLMSLTCELPLVK